MSMFTIDADHNITAYASAEEARQGEVAGRVYFDSPASSPRYAASGR